MNFFKGAVKVLSSFKFFGFIVWHRLVVSALFTMTSYNFPSLFSHFSNGKTSKAIKPIAFFIDSLGNNALKGPL